MNVKIRTAAKSMEVGYKNRSKKYFVKKDINYALVKVFEKELRRDLFY